MKRNADLQQDPGQQSNWQVFRLELRPVQHQPLRATGEAGQNHHPAHREVDPGPDLIGE